MNETSPTRTGIGRPRVAVTLAVVLIAILLTAAAAQASPSLSSWSETGTFGATQAGVSCPSFGLCVSVGGADARVTTTPTTSGSWTPQAISGATTLQAVSCAPGTALCVTVGDGGVVAANSNTNSTSSWSAQAGFDSSNTLTSVSCPSTSFCLAVDSSGNVVYSATNPALPESWQTVTAVGHSLSAVSCLSAQFCAAIDTTGQILTSTSPLTAGSWNPVYSDGNDNLKSIFCAANDTCVAVDASGTVIASDDANVTPSTWSATHEAAALSAVACTAQAVCIAGGGSTIIASDNPAAASPSWSSSSPGSTINGVSCTEQGLCAFADSSGAWVAQLPAPTVTTGAGSAGSQTTATLSATVNANDADITNCYFNYGPTTTYGSSVPCSSTPSPTGGTQTVSAAISGLSANTTYHFQIVATNAIGTSAGADATFSTPALLKPAPTITGTAAVGDTLTCTLGVTVPAGATVSYTWVRDTTAIAGATGATYVVALADETHHLYCTALITAPGGGASASSPYVAVPSETLGTVFETTVGPPSSTARAVTTSITCSPQAVSSCVVSLTLTTTGHHPVKLGSKTTRIAPGAQVSVTVALNATGRAILALRHHFKATLTVTGTVVGVIKATLSRQTIKFTTASRAKRHEKRAR